MKISAIFLSFLLLVSCHTGQQKEIEEISLQSINLPSLLESDLLSDQDVLDAVRFVRLETHEECFLSYVKRAEVFEGRIYLLDDKSNLLSFDVSSGKFIARVGAIGQGPGEYTGVSNFYVNRKKRYIGVVDIASSTVFRYTLSNKFIDRVNYPGGRDVFLQGFYSWNDWVMLETRNGPTQKMPYSYIVLNEGDLSLHSYQIPFTMVGESNSGPSYLYNANVGEDFYAKGFLSDTIYIWDKERFVPTILLETGMKRSTPEVIAEHAPYEMLTDADRKLGLLGYSSGAERICATDKYLYLEYFYSGYHAILWDLESGRGCVYRLKGSDNSLLHIYNELITTSEDALVRCVSVDLLLYAKEDILASEQRAHIVDLYNGLKEDDNPVIVFYDYEKLFNANR